ncbi:MAG: hypothetical protein RR219_09390 [Clostridiales bacterium]
MYEKRLDIPLFITIIGIATSLIYLMFAGGSESIGGKNMEIQGYIAIGIALIAVTGGIWASLVQFKKDGNSIVSIKGDTADVKPRIEHIQNGVKDVGDRIISLNEKILPSLPKLDGIDVIVKDVERRMTLQAEVRNNGPSIEYLLAAVKQVYIDNVECKNVLKKEKERYMILEDKYIQSTIKVNELSKEKERLIKKVHDLQPALQYDDWEPEQ